LRGGMGMHEKGCRRRVELTDEWEQIELLCGWSERRDYELIRPLVLFASPASERAAETGSPSERTLQRRVVRIDARGLESRFRSEAVRRLHQTSNLGAFRVHAALAQVGIHLGPRTCGCILATNRALYSLGKSMGPSKKKREMPFAAARRHQFWTADVRYVGDHGLAGREAALWPVAESLTLEHEGESLSCYEVSVEAETGQLRSVGRPRLFGTSAAAAQSKLFGLDALGEGGWLTTLKLEGYAPQRLRGPLALRQTLVPHAKAL
jgi:hypothetical protein